MSFKEAILIPKKEYLALKSQFHKKSDILSSPLLAPDQKVKLYEQERLTKKGVKDYLKTIGVNKSLNIKDDIKSSTNTTPLISDGTKIFPAAVKLKTQPQPLPAKTLPRGRIYTNTSKDKLPFVSSIIDIVEEKPDDIYWDNNYRLYIDKLEIRNADIVTIFQYLMKELIVTRDQDIPEGSLLVQNKLREIGVPKSWIPQSIKKSTIRRLSTLTQSGQGAKKKKISWLSY